ncbi:hypothetical protein FJT64_018422 [Amphibalanus amphitrite]|uniref:Uncharacterized protein n=1 Tax=Amphibalanus amphitrite TaxID=1232801 RepID=A0A6A4WTZ5_AMPAM|nr:hypothetical protein FJT64_018422 [Amphibalanus amphitrite]
METYTNLLHLERVLRCQQESAPAPEDGSAPEQRWRRRRRSFQLAAAGDGLSERSGPPPPANGGPTAVDDTSPQDRLERRVTELEADVRRIDQEKEEIRVKYTTVLKRLRRLQVSSSENWDVKSPPESISEEIPVPGSPPMHQPPPRPASPKEDAVPHDGGDTYTGGGGDICGSFRGWPTGSGSPPLLSPLVVFARPPDQTDGVKSLCEVTDSATQTETEHRSDAETIAALEATLRRKDSVIATMQSNLAKVERQLVGTRQQLQTIEADVLRRLEEAEQSWQRKRRQLQVDLADERAVSQTLHAVEADLSEQLRRCRRRCAELEAGLPDRSERGAAAERGTETRCRRRSRRLATLCHQLTEHVGRLMAAQTRLTGELLSTLQQLFSLFTVHNPAVAAPCQEATLATLPLWLPWLAAEARLACRDRQQRHLDPVSPPEALPSPPVGGAPPHLSALVRQVWDDIERLRRLDLEEPASLGEVEDRPPPIEESME